ncbi:MAG: glycosyltransferase family 25 protein [Flavobacteriaceae bacterium]|nr:glycosyltransferase family 25 protein [Flavobacteriaceae bacterium]|tara:strand:+ start:17338 stop:17934 length:597 start_codon:yes stop_codon:yes gene_type:complete
MYKLKVISLPKREDRRKKIAHMFQHIDFEFCDGIDGETYKLTEFDKEFIKGNDYEKYGIDIPSLVCANYTHLNLLDECSKQDLPFFIFEDDVFLLGDHTPPENYFETLASVNDLDAFWFIPNEPSIAAYIVWPEGAKKMVEYVENVSKLRRGLDWAFWDLRKSKDFRGDQANVSYFGHNPGEDSDITTLENYDISSNE